MAPFQDEQNDQQNESSNYCPITTDAIYNDAFLHYSNDDIRLEALKMTECPTQDQVFTLQRDCISTKGKPERKTRISFELHPSLILEDLLADLSDDGNDTKGEYACSPEHDLLKELLKLK